MRRFRFALLLAASLQVAPAEALEVAETRRGLQGAPGEDGESVTASATGIAAGDEPATVTARALGGAGGSGGGSRPAGDGGGPALGEVFGGSERGAVAVLGEAVGGRGGVAVGEGGQGGDGASVRLVDAVDGETRGRLSLTQRARGGEAGAPLGRPGDAESVLVRAKSAALLVLSSEALGEPRELLLFTPSDVGGEGARSSATAVGENAAGAATVRAVARAGGGGPFVREGLSARGGAGGFQGFAGPGELPGRGGSALSQAIGTGAGGSPVDVLAEALGGPAGGASEALVLGLQAPDLLGGIVAFEEREQPPQGQRPLATPRGRHADLGIPLPEDRAVDGLREGAAIAPGELASGRARLLVQDEGGARGRARSHESCISKG
jgi:hypothetical protein